MPKNIVREFVMEDNLMLQLAQVFHDNFVEDQAAFVADFPNLDTPFETNFQTAIDDADAIPSGAAVDGQIKFVTEQLNAKLPLGQKALQKLYVYVGEAWNSKGKEAEFGRSKYVKARNSQIRMKELLELAHAAANETNNKAALLAAGYTQAAIDELKTIENDIDSLNRQQEQMLSKRKFKSEERIKALNAVWEFMQRINKASKVTFVDSPAKIEQYMLYPTASESLPKPQNIVAVVDGVDPNLANLTWDAVVGAMSYKVYFSEVNVGEPSGIFGEILDVEGVTNAQVPIIPAKRNYWKIKAFGDGLESGYSDEVWLEGVV